MHSNFQPWTDAAFAQGNNIGSERENWQILWEILVVPAVKRTPSGFAAHSNLFI